VSLGDPEMAKFNNFVMFCALASILLLKAQVSMTVTHTVSVVGVAGWSVILTGWLVTGNSGRGQPANRRC